MTIELAHAPRLTRRYHLDLCLLAGGLCPGDPGCLTPCRQTR
ncbi:MULTISPECIES: hypothetical protein [unclassified Streptomyces]